MHVTFLKLHAILGYFKLYYDRSLLNKAMLFKAIRLIWIVFSTKIVRYVYEEQNEMYKAFQLFNVSVLLFNSRHDVLHFVLSYRK